MLVLARKSQEAVVIGGSNGYEQVLKVTVLEVRGGTVKLGFEAGAEVPIHRAEVWSASALRTARRIRCRLAHGPSKRCHALIENSERQ